MKNLEKYSRETIFRGTPVWAWALFGVLACLSLGTLLIRRSPERRESARLQVQSASRDQSTELERLKHAVDALEQKSAALAIAVSSPERAVDQRVAREEPVKAAAQVEDTRSAAEVQQDEITALEVRFESEKDGSRDSLVAARTMQAELSAAPLGGARVREVACSTSLCRATLEQDVSARPMDVNALIESTPSVRRESMLNYEAQGSVKRVTIYSAREGYHLGSSEPDAAPSSGK